MSLRPFGAALLLAGALTLTFNGVVHAETVVLPSQERIEGNWNDAAGKVREQWGRLTNDDIAVINGQRQQLVGQIQIRYGIAKEEAERQVKDWETRQRAVKN